MAIHDRTAPSGQNGGMVVTPDVIGVIVAVFVAAVTFLGGVGGMLSRQSRRIDARFDKVDARIERVEAEIGSIRSELTEVKIAIARIEGPQPRFLRPSH